ALVERRLLARDALRQGARRPAALSGISVHELHARDARRCRRDLRVPAVARARDEAARRAHGALSVRHRARADGLARAVLSSGPTAARRATLRRMAARRLPRRRTRALR